MPFLPLWWRTIATACKLWAFFFRQVKYSTVHRELFSPGAALISNSIALSQTPAVAARLVDSTNGASVARCACLLLSFCWYQWVSKYSLTPHSTQYRSFRRHAFQQLGSFIYDTYRATLVPTTNLYCFVTEAMCVWTTFSWSHSTEQWLGLKPRHKSNALTTTPPNHTTNYQVANDRSRFERFVLKWSAPSRTVYSVDMTNTLKTLPRNIRYKNELADVDWRKFRVW